MEGEQDSLGPEKAGLEAGDVELGEMTVTSRAGLYLYTPSMLETRATKINFYQVQRNQFSLLPCFR